MAAKNELSDVDYVDDTRLFLVTLVGESSYALSTPRVWRIWISLTKNSPCYVRYQTSRLVLTAFGGRSWERYQVGASHWPQQMAERNRIFFRV